MDMADHEVTSRELAYKFSLQAAAISKERYASQVAHALIAIGLGELDSAMLWLEEGWATYK